MGCGASKDSKYKGGGGQAAESVKAEEAAAAEKAIAEDAAAKVPGDHKMICFNV